MSNKFMILMVLFFASKSILAQGTSYICDPQVDCQTAASPGALVPDPTDCERYYVCVLSGSELVPSPESLSCPQNEYFNQTTGQCTPEFSAGICPNVCRENGMCDTKCPSPATTTTLVADNTDCGIYYLCDGNSNYTGRCPSNTPYFNGITCVEDISQCCMCIPYCPTPFIQIQDPCNCHAYYVCQTKGQPHESNRIICMGGEYFDETSNRCEVGTCISICSNCENSPFTTLPPTTTSTTSTISTTPRDNCQTTFNCPTDGNFPRCNYCDPSYFYCKGGNATVEYCSGVDVFNPSIQYPYCIPPENCPF